MKEGTGFGIASMCCGIAGILLFLAPYLGLPLSILAIIFRYKQPNNGFSVAGLTTGIIGIVLNTVMGIIFGIMFLFATAMVGI